MSFAFFFSYARANRRNCERANPLGASTNLLDQLFNDLVTTVHDDLGGDQTRVGYRDVEELRIGDPWPRNLADAVCQARVLVTVFAPGYFESINCGREFLVFKERVQAHRDNHDISMPTPIVPIFWTNENTCRRSPGDWIEEHFGDIQYKQAGMPTRYPGVGCKQLMDLHHQEYRQLIYCLGQAICDLEVRALRALEPAPAFHQLRSAFRTTTGVAGRERELTLELPPAVPVGATAGQPLPLIRPAP